VKAHLLVAIAAGAGLLSSACNDATSPRDAVLRNVIIYTTTASGSWQLEVVHPDGSGRRQITQGGGDYYTPAISPDGRRIAAAKFDGNVPSIYVMDADGTNFKKIGRSSGDYGPAWSPDGSRIAFRSTLDIGGNAFGRIFLMNADGTGLQQLTDDPTPSDAYSPYDDAPRWSPDGTRILFTRNGVLHVMNADGTGVTSLANADGAGSPAWSPDGTRIAYGSFWDGMDIRIRNADGSNRVSLTTDTTQEGGPSWSPDGQWLVFERIVDGRARLFVMHADGTGEVGLTAGYPHQTQPSWSPVP
jgi:TolB protein